MLARFLNALLVILGLAIIHLPSTALSQTYQTWQNPDDASPRSSADEARLKDIVERMNTMLDQAEKDRAADPTLLQDLRNIAAELSGNGIPVSEKQVLLDEFTDGDYTRNPAWTVGLGRYWIEENWGLRNALNETKKTSSDSSSKGNAARIFGQILNQALGGSSSGTSASNNPGIQPTSIFTSAAIPNAFSIELNFSSWVNKGEFIIGPYQGSDRASGYRLSYRVGEGLALRIKSRSGARTIAIDPGPFRLEDKKAHTLLWTRVAGGAMQVHLDGKSILSVKDASFRDPFIGFGMATRGGDFIVKKVSVRTPGGG